MEKNFKKVFSKSSTAIGFSIMAIAAIALLVASGPIVTSQQATAFAGMCYRCWTSQKAGDWAWDHTN